MGLGLAAVAMLLGEQIALFCQQPRLWVLLHDWRSMWLIFSTGPVAHVLFLIVILCRPDQVSSPRAIFQRFWPSGPLSGKSAIGIAILCLPILALFLTLSEYVFRVGSLALAALFLRMAVPWAEKIGIPHLALCGMVGLAFGLIGGVTLGDFVQRVYECRSETMQLDNGDTIACRGLVRLESRSLWLVEGPTPPLLLSESYLAIMSAFER